MNTTRRTKTVGTILLFSILVMGVAFLAPLLGGGPSSMGPGFLLWGAAPCLVALLMRLVTHDWADAGLKPSLRTNARGYLFVVAVCLGLVAVMLVLGGGFGVLSLVGFAWGPYLQMVLPGLVAFSSLPFLKSLAGAAIWFRNWLRSG